MVWFRVIPHLICCLHTTWGNIRAVWLQFRGSHGRPEEAPGSWLQFGSYLDSCGHWGVNQQVEGFFIFLSLSLYRSSGSALFEEIEKDRDRSIFILLVTFPLTTTARAWRDLSKDPGASFGSHACVQKPSHVTLHSQSISKETDQKGNTQD